jgi:Cobalamin-independent synthase, Catalytic domain
VSANSLRLWPSAAACGVGSLPGTSAREAVQLVIDELPTFLHLPELPARGPGADLTGRTLALLADFAAEWGPSGWGLVDRRGRDLRRAASWLDEDLDALEELADGWSGPLKVQVCGPWTLAATVELRSTRKVLSDAGAMRDLHQAYAEAVVGHFADLAKRLPLAQLLVQLDEPALPLVLAGGVPTPSGLARLAAVDRQDVQSVLRAVAEAVPAPVGVHCCAAAPPVEVLAASGAQFLSLDATLLTERDDDVLGEALEAGVRLMLGLVSSLPLSDGAEQAQPPSAADLAAPARGLWHRLGLPLEQLADLAVTPTCGLAGAPPQYARVALARCVETARALADDPEDRRG